MASRKKQIVLLKAKTEIGKAKLSYHGEKWLLVEIAVSKLVRSKGECYVCRSLDGKQILLVSVDNDPDLKCERV